MAAAEVKSGGAVSRSAGGEKKGTFIQYALSKFNSNLTRIRKEGDGSCGMNFSCLFFSHEESPLHHQEPFIPQSEKL